MTTERTCRCCGQTLGIAHFGIDRSQADGINKVCRTCKRKRDTCTAGGYVKPERDQATAAPRTITVSAGSISVASDAVYYRNDGHKHIKSRGVSC